MSAILKCVFQNWKKKCIFQKKMIKTTHTNTQKTKQKKKKTKKYKNNNNNNNNFAC